jgi:hypothetical protein
MAAGYWVLDTGYWLLVAEISRRKAIDSSHLISGYGLPFEGGWLND